MFFLIVSVVVFVFVSLYNSFLSLSLQHTIENVGVVVFIFASEANHLRSDFMINVSGVAVMIEAASQSERTNILPAISALNVDSVAVVDDVDFFFCCVH